MCLILLLLCLLPACSWPAGSESPPTRSPARLVEVTEQHMGTLVTAAVVSHDEDEARRALREGFEQFNHLNQLHSTWVESSDISRINQAAGKGPVVVSPETLLVLKQGLKVSELTEGAFDLSYYALQGLWHFDQDLDPTLPRAADIEARLPLINYRRIQVDEVASTVALPTPGMALNLGGITKGFAVDGMVAVLRSRGFEDGFVQAGGDLLFFGQQGDQPWTAGIQDPRGPYGDSFARVKLPEAGAFSTSGDYERSFVVEGVRYHHILDPRTGYPARGLRSVTLWVKNAFEADALTTGIFVMGPERGMALIESLPGVEGVLVTQANQVLISTGLQGRVEILHPPTDGI